MNADNINDVDMMIASVQNLPMNLNVPGQFRELLTLLLNNGFILVGLISENDQWQGRVVVPANQNDPIIQTLATRPETVPLMFMFDCGVPTGIAIPRPIWDYCTQKFSLI